MASLRGRYLNDLKHDIGRKIFAKRNPPSAAIAAPTGKIGPCSFSRMPNHSDDQVKGTGGTESILAAPLGASRSARSLGQPRMDLR